MFGSHEGKISYNYIIQDYVWNVKDRVKMLKTSTNHITYEGHIFEIRQSRNLTQYQSTV